MTHHSDIPGREAYDHYGDWTANTAGKIVEQEPLLDAWITGIAMHQDDEYGFEEAAMDAFASYLFHKQWVVQYCCHQVNPNDLFVRENTYQSDVPSVLQAFIEDLALELNEFVNQRMYELDEDL